MIENLRFLGECVIPIRWCDLDNYGHVNNARYFEYMTEGRAKILGDSVTPYDNIQYLLVDTSCNFQKAINYPCDLKIKHYLKVMGRTSFTIFCQMMSADESIIYAHGEAKLVCFDSTLQKAVLIPDMLMERFV
jgi:acyl-CoA thioester hydrolase